MSPRFEPKKIYIDSETCGLHSMMVLLQYAVEDGPIVLWDVWKKPVGETLDLIEWICQHTVVGFNLAFDWFHIVKIYTIWSLCDRDWIPEDHIEEIALLEPQGQDGPCVKPYSALDLLLHSRKGPYQSLMARENIRIRRVPTVLAYALAQVLEDTLEIDDIYTAKSADKDAPKWHVFDITNRKTGDVDNDFKDVVLRFSPAGGLKYLAEHALKRLPKYHYKDVEPNPDWYPEEMGFAPTALAMSGPELGWEVWKEKEGKPTLVGHAWPAVIKKFIDHWYTREDAREYATDDIVYTRDLDKHFGQLQGLDELPAGDDDSVLACMVPVVRWRGFKIDIPGIRELLKGVNEVIAKSPVNVNKPKDVRAYLEEVLDPTEMEVIELSTKKRNIEEIAGYEVQKVMDVVAELNGEEDEDDDELEILDAWKSEHPEHCMKCDGTGEHINGFCKRCNGKGYLEPGDHPAALRAKEILKIKAAVKERELYEKLLRAGKFHASFNIIGTLSSRMSGGDGLNAQGIKDAKYIRTKFPLKWDGYLLCGGDFDSFEVTLADAVYVDPDLRAALTTKVPCHACGSDGTCHSKKCEECKGTGTHACEECEGTKFTLKKLHGMFGTALFPPMTYAEIMADAEKYKKAKSGVFAMTYGGNARTLNKNLKVAMEVAEAAYDNWGKMFPGIGRARARVERMFCGMQQPGGIGTAIMWREPSECVESFLGFRRYFTLENKICRALFDLARKPKKEWRDEKIKVVRSTKDFARLQTAGGAVASALYGAAFGIQSANLRAAANHEIQSPGGQITKHVQRSIWDLQPHGIHILRVAPMNIHDELMVVVLPEYVSAVTDVVKRIVEFYRAKVPLLGMTWFENMANWAEKKSSAGARQVKIRAPEMMLAA